MAAIFLTIMFIDREVCFLLQNFDFLYVVDPEELQCMEAIVVAKQILSATLCADKYFQRKDKMPECRILFTVARVDELDPTLFADCCK